MFLFLWKDNIRKAENSTTLLTYVENVYNLLSLFSGLAIRSICIMKKLVKLYNIQHISLKVKTAKLNFVYYAFHMEGLNLNCDDIMMIERDSRVTVFSCPNLIDWSRVKSCFMHDMTAEIARDIR